MVRRRNSVVTATVRETRYFECWLNEANGVSASGLQQKKKVRLNNYFTSALWI